MRTNERIRGTIQTTVFNDGNPLHGLPDDVFHRSSCLRRGQKTLQIPRTPKTKPTTMPAMRSPAKRGNRESMKSSGVLESQRTGPNATKKAKAEAANQRSGINSWVKYEVTTVIAKSKSGVDAPAGNSIFGVIARVLTQRIDANTIALRPRIDHEAHIPDAPRSGQQIWQWRNSNG